MRCRHNPPATRGRQWGRGRNPDSTLAFPLRGANRLWGATHRFPRTRVGSEVPDLLRRLLQRALQQGHDAADDLGLLQQLLLHDILHQIDAHSLLPGGEGQERETLLCACASSKYPKRVQKPGLKTPHERPRSTTPTRTLGFVDFCLLACWLPGWLAFKTGSPYVSQAGLLILLPQPLNAGTPACCLFLLNLAICSEVFSFLRAHCKQLSFDLEFQRQVCLSLVLVLFLDKKLNPERKKRFCCSVSNQ